MVGQREKPLTAGPFDVVVCGGGPAGLCAAVAAARMNAKTALIERHNFLGGTATAGMVTPISEYNKGGRRIIGGIPWELALRLEKMGGAVLDYSNGNVPFDQEVYKLAAQRMVLEANIFLMLDTWASCGEFANGRIGHIEALNKSGRHRVEGRIFVDCTGDADIAYQAGAPMQPAGESLQPMTLWFRLGGVATRQLEGLRLDKENFSGRNGEIRALLQASKDAGTFGGPWFFPGPAPDIINVNITRTAGDATDWESSQRAALSLREDVFRLTALLKKFSPAFKDCYLLDTAPQTGVRETRRLLGVHTVTAKELLDCALFPDAIARGAHPMDMHDAHSAAQSLTGFEKAYHIPYQCMIATGLDNMLVAGRCVSATREAQSTMRVQATCMAEGEAAGYAAALCAKNRQSVHALDTGILQKELRERDALPD